MAKPKQRWSKTFRQAAMTVWIVGLLMLLSTAMLTGCASVLQSDKPAREVYLLQPPSISTGAAVADAAKLVLSLITVPGLDTDDIQVLGPNARLIPVANAHWADNLPEVMSSLSRRALVDSGLFRSVDLNDIARPGNWQLNLELQAFYGVQNSAGDIVSVLMQLEGNLRCGQKTEVNTEVNTEIFKLESRQNVASASLTDLVDAHQRALNETLQALPVRIQQSCSET